VKLSLTREEDFYEHVDYPVQVHLKLAARADGTLLGAEMELVTDIGAHNIQPYSFLGVCVGWLVSLYRLPNVRYKGIAVYTNKTPSCAKRASATPRSPSRWSRSWTNWRTGWGWTRWSCGGRTTSAWATPSGDRGRWSRSVVPE
jgi:hypothetical protein